MKRFILSTLAIILFVPFGVIADQGMWLPMLIGKYNIEDMQSKGFKLTAEDVYSINQPSIKDAIVIFGRGCTGELISPEGLLITNHHCGYGVIQSHSSVEHDYLTHGFWAMTRQEELHNPGLTVRFLVRMDDVTERVLSAIPDGAGEQVRDSIVGVVGHKITEEATSDNHYTARVMPMFYGNQYFLFIYEEFLDVRLVGAPPSDIGKFGGDTDNWMWPRHTGDFSLFRIYADKDNNPAAYSPDNVPYTPKRFLPISLKGVNPGDFTMVYGYPGSTQQYASSQAVAHVVDDLNPLNISLRDARLKVMEQHMRQSDTVRIKYASKQAGVANAWKKWIGERNGLIRLDAIEKKQQLEKNFEEWVNESPIRVEEYGHLLNSFDELYATRKPLSIAASLSREAFYAVELLQLVRQFGGLLNNVDNSKLSEEQYSRLIDYTRDFYKNYHKPIDVEIFTTMMSQLSDILPPALTPLALEELKPENSDDWYAIALGVYSQSVFADSTALISMLADSTSSRINVLQNDIMYRLSNQFDSIYSASVYPSLRDINSKLDLLYRTYVKGLMQMNPNAVYYPDANFTLRVTYGKIEGYFPSDGKEYMHQATLDGIAEKSRLDVYDYTVPQRLLDLYETKDYGKWEVNGTIPVTFLASNHTSGGNSGSPVINAEGHLVGVNFDRVWEGTMSDIMFDPDMCRNISIDIRYALFIIDKYASAGHLLEEMTLIE
ncbi:MAG: S46 family peptidase [Bacteroidales bacterium]|nr:S46 family peptidase [Bacteroidales bacterium]